MVRRTPERVALELPSFCVRPPENESHVNAACGCTAENIQCRPSVLRHLEGGPHESHSHPNAPLGHLDRLADTPKCWFAVDQRPQEVSRTNRIGIRLHKGNGGDSHHRRSAWAICHSLVVNPP